MLRNISLFICFLISLTTIAQDHTDALRYSQEQLWGSGRYLGMGGAFGSLGANATSTSYNPAGLAVHTTNELSTSFSFLNTETEGIYYSNSSFGKESTFSIPNINYVSANIFDPEEIGDWNRFNFGIGYNKLADYNKNIFASGEQSDHSFVDLVMENAQGVHYENLYGFFDLLAFNTDLIDTIGGTNIYSSPVNGSMNKNQSFSSIESGGKNEFYLSFGTAYQNKLFLGATIGFPSIDFRRTRTWTESNFHSNDETAEEVTLDNYKYQTNLNVSGAGINLKLGLIYLLEDNIRYGFALHTPTYYEINEEYWSSMSTDFNESAFYAESGLGIFDYNLNTPFKIMNSLSYIINKKGIISLDYEYIDYSTSNLSSDFVSFHDENTSIENNYTSASNIRVGTELRIHPQLSLRGGYAYYGSPFTGDLNDASQEYMTMGFGIKIDQYFFDLAIVNSMSNANIFMYDNDASEISTSNNRNQLLISTGIKF